MDWEPGDLALLFIAGRRACPNSKNGFHRGDYCPPLGSVRKVVGITQARWETGSVGTPCGCTKLIFSDGTTATTWRCKKVTPDTEDAFDREVISALTGEPVHVPANALPGNSFHREDECGQQWDRSQANREGIGG